MLGNTLSTEPTPPSMTTGRVTIGLPSRLGHARLMRLLGLSTAGVDPVTIITAAQVRLRRWRRTDAVRARRPRLADERIRQISEARDVLLREAVGGMRSPRRPASG